MNRMNTNIMHRLILSIDIFSTWQYDRWHKYFNLYFRNMYAILSLSYLLSSSRLFIGFPYSFTKIFFHSVICRNFYTRHKREKLRILILFKKKKFKIVYISDFTPLRLRLKLNLSYRFT